MASHFIFYVFFLLLVVTATVMAIILKCVWEKSELGGVGLSLPHRVDGRWMRRRYVNQGQISSDQIKWPIEVLAALPK